MTLRHCRSDAQALLDKSFNSSAVHPNGNEEQAKAQLRQWV